MSEWICPAACHAVSPRRRCQDWAGLSSPAVKNAIRSSSSKAPRTTRLQARLGEARGRRASPPPPRRSARRARPRAAPRPRPPGAHATRRSSAISGGTSISPSSTLATNSTGLDGQRCRAASGRRARRPAPARCAPARPACSASITCSSHFCLGDRVLVAAARLPHHALEPALGLLEVGVDQLGLDRLDVAHRVDAALGVDDVRGRVGADDVHDARRSRGCWPGTGCPGPRPCGRRPPGRRCRGRRSCRARSSTP